MGSRACVALLSRKCYSVDGSGAAIYIVGLGDYLQELNPDLSVVVLGFNSASFIGSCIASVADQTRVRVQLIVVDNGSSDDTYRAAKKAMGDREWGSCIRSELALGFAEGCNLGASYAKGNILLFLNDDCVLEEGALVKFSEAFDGQYVGVVGLGLADGGGTKWDTLGHFVDTNGYLCDVGRGVRRVAGLPPMIRVFGVGGAALGIRRSLFDSLGGFDERMEFLFEETDLCWRANLAGVEIYVLTDAVALHKHLSRYSSLQEARSRESEFFYETRNRVRAIIKNFEARSAVRALGWQVAGRLALVGVLLLSGRWRASRDVCRGLLWNLVHLDDSIRARRYVRNTRLVSDAALVSAGLIGVSSVKSMFAARRGSVPFSEVRRRAWQGNGSLAWRARELVELLGQGL